MVLPGLLFNGGQENCQQIVDFLEEMKEDGSKCDWKQADLCSTVYDYLLFSEHAKALSSSNEALTDGQGESNVQDLMTRLESIQSSLARISTRKHLCSTYFGHYRAVPRHVCIQEMGGSLMMLEAHLITFLKGGNMNPERLSRRVRGNKKLSHISQFWVPDEENNDLLVLNRK